MLAESQEVKESDDLCSWTKFSSRRMVWQLVKGFGCWIMSVRVVLKCRASCVPGSGILCPSLLAKREGSVTLGRRWAR